GRIRIRCDEHSIPAKSRECFHAQACRAVGAITSELKSCGWRSERTDIEKCRARCDAIQKEIVRAWRGERAIVSDTKGLLLDGLEHQRDTRRENRILKSAVFVDSRCCCELEHR